MGLFVFWCTITLCACIAAVCVCVHMRVSVFVVLLKRLLAPNNFVRVSLCVRVCAWAFFRGQQSCARVLRYVSMCFCQCACVCEYVLIVCFFSLFWRSATSSTCVSFHISLYMCVFSLCFVLFFRRWRVSWRQETKIISSPFALEKKPCARCAFATTMICDTYRSTCTIRYLYRCWLLYLSYCYGWCLVDGTLFVHASARIFFDRLLADHRSVRRSVGRLDWHLSRVTRGIHG